MARTLIVTDPLALVAPPGPQTARTLTASLPLAIEENAAANTIRVYQADIGGQNIGIFVSAGPFVSIVDELPSPGFSGQSPAWSLVNYV